ncbi:MAG: nuclease-related domain-containing protein [Acidimicrobiales bacterium]
MVRTVAAPQTPAANAGSSALVAGDEERRARRRARAGAVLALMTSAAASTSGMSSAGVAEVAWMVTAGASLVLAAWLARRHRDPDRWKRGAAGEQATAALLARRLRGSRWVVLHDRRVPGSQANLDHVVIGPTGVWLIDTKTTRAVVRARWRSVWFGDRRLDVGPLAWEASVLAERLGVTVRPLVVVHRCGPPAARRGLGRRGRRVSGIPVLAADRMVARLKRRSRLPRLRRSEVAVLAARCDALFPSLASPFRYPRR